MKRLNLIGLKVTIMGAALSISGPAVESGEMFLGGLALMLAGLFIRDKISEENER